MDAQKRVAVAEDAETTPGRKRRGKRGAMRRLSVGPEPIAGRVRTADTMGARMKGLLGRSGLEADEGLWIVPCNSIHMFFMRFAIDVVFLDREHRVVRVHEAVQPWRMARGGKGAHSVLELPSGTAAFFNLRVGDRLTLE